MAFKLWSELSVEAKGKLIPELGQRSWDVLTTEEKKNLWRHFRSYFFFENPVIIHWGENYFEFTPPNEEAKRGRIYLAISLLDKFYKVNNYAVEFAKDGSYFSSCYDFHSIFINNDGDVVLELLSLYCKALIDERNPDYFLKNIEQEEDDKQQELLNRLWSDFDEFAQDLNEIFSDFGINVYLTRNGFIPKQEEKIIDDLYEPVLKCLSNPKWQKVNGLFSDAFLEFRQNTPQGYSSCVTHTVAAVEALLQIIVRGKAGEGDFAGLISEGQRNGLIPMDIFTKDMFKTIISILMKERKETGNAHVKQSYATERNARMVLNVSMVFIQHCILV